jgi:predicted O-methyltransferase YrrM
MNASDLRRALADVPGWLGDEEALALFELARGCTGRGAIVELGSWRGRSTICLALGSKEGSGVPVVAVDRHMDKTFVDFQENIRRAGVADLVRPIRATSDEAFGDFDEPIELIFIDASHKYEDVRRDFDQWVPLVVEGGTVAMHDTTWEGSKLVSEEAIYRSPHFKDVRFVPSSTTVGVKAQSVTARDRRQSRRALLAKWTAELGMRLRRFLPRSLVRAGRRTIASVGGGH